MYTWTSKSVVLFVIACSILLSACNSNLAKDAIRVLAETAGNGNHPASHQSINMNPRTDPCSLADKVKIMNAIDADLTKAGKAELEITADQWLDRQMPAHKCITAKPAPTATPTK